MADIKEAAEKPGGPNEEKQSSAGPGLGLFAFTIDANTGQITKLEKVDSAGTRRELSEHDKASLQACKSLEAIVEQAFEAGVDCVLGNEDEKDEAQESEDEVEVRRILLLPLMERSRILTLLQPNVLARAILAMALQQVTAPHSSEASSSSPQQKSGSAVKPHRPGSAGPAHH